MKHCQSITDGKEDEGELPWLIEEFATTALIPLFLFLFRRSIKKNSGWSLFSPFFFLLT
jgi:hypothetical protein